MRPGPSQSGQRGNLLNGMSQLVEPGLTNVTTTVSCGAMLTNGHLEGTIGTTAIACRGASFSFSPRSAGAGEAKVSSRHNPQRWWIANHALQRTRSAVTLAASCRHLSPAMQPARQLRESLSLGSFGVSLAPSVNDAFSSQFRTHALGNSWAFASTSLVSSELAPSRPLHAASAFPAAAWSARHRLRLHRGLSPVWTFLGGSLSARRSVFHARTPHAGANPTRTPNQALQRTAPVCHACCSPQSPPRSSHASPPQSLSLRSLGYSQLSPLKTSPK
jgi:hypothetical protein